MSHNKQPKAIKEHFIGGWNTFQPTKVQGSEDRNVEKDNTSSHCLIYDFLIAATNLWAVQTGVADFVVRSWRNYGIREI